MTNDGRAKLRDKKKVEDEVGWKGDFCGFYIFLTEQK